MTIYHRGLETSEGVIMAEIPTKGDVLSTMHNIMATETVDQWASRILSLPSIWLQDCPFGLRKL